MGYVIMAIVYLASNVIYGMNHDTIIPLFIDIIFFIGCWAIAVFINIYLKNRRR